MPIGRFGTGRATDIDNGAVPLRSGSRLKEDFEGRHSDRRGWQVDGPYRTGPPVGLDGVEEGIADVDEVWLDAIALRARSADPAR